MFSSFKKPLFILSSDAFRLFANVLKMGPYEPTNGGGTKGPKLWTTNFKVWTTNFGVYGWISENWWYYVRRYTWRVGLLSLYDGTYGAAKVSVSNHCPFPPVLLCWPGGFISKRKVAKNEIEAGHKIQVLGPMHQQILIWIYCIRKLMHLEECMANISHDLEADCLQGHWTSNIM